MSAQFDKSFAAFCDGHRVEAERANMPLEAIVAETAKQKQTDTAHMICAITTRFALYAINDAAGRSTATRARREERMCVTHDGESDEDASNPE